MKMNVLRRPRRAPADGIVGTARVDRHTQALIRRLRPGDVAVIDHADLDRASAVALVEASVAAVINVSPSMTGRYPNQGPGVILDAGIPLIDDVGSSVFAAISDGDGVRISGGTVYVRDEAVGSGAVFTHDTLEDALAESREGMGTQLQAFSANAVEHLRHERELLLEGVGVPDLPELRHRPVVVVTKTHDYDSDLRGLRTFIAERKPMLLGVGAGADVLLEQGHRPDVIITAADQVSDAALRCGARIVAQTTRDGRVADADRFERLGVEHVSLASEGNAEDSAFVLAHHNKADLIVTVGSHAGLVELLDKGRSGMASSFLSRAAVGATLVDAKAVARLYTHRIKTWMVMLGLLVALIVVCAAIATTPVGQDWWGDLTSLVERGFETLKGQFT